MTAKPFSACFSEKQKKDMKKKLKDHLEKGFQKMNKSTLTKAEVTGYIQRFFLALLKPNDEFDDILVNRAISAILQFEVKTYP